MGTFGVFCSVQTVLWRRNIIMIDVDFTEICKYVRIATFGVCCLVKKKVFRYPRRLTLLNLAQDIITLVLALSVGSTGWLPLLPLKQDIISETLTFGLDMVRSTHRGRGVDVWRC